MKTLTRSLPGRRLSLRRFASVLLVACLLSTVTACCTDPVTQESYFCLGETSEADEIALGLQYAPNFIAQNGGSYPDPELYEYLRHIVIDKMAKTSHRNHLPWEFTILNTSQVNAFALPGGQVFVTRGLLARLESEAQFAHLMGHEIGHVSHRHSVKGQGREALFQILIGTVALAEREVVGLDPDEPPLIAGTLSALGQLAMLRFSRDQELECDQRGVDYALQAGYDPHESKKTFEMFLAMKQASGVESGLFADLLATHPPDERRIDEIQHYIEHHHPESVGREDLVVNGREWQRLLARVQAEHRVYERHDEALSLVQQARQQGRQDLLDEAEAALRQCQRELPGHATFPVSLGLVSLERDDANDAIRHLNSAVQISPRHFEARLYRGLAYHRRSQQREALLDMTEAQELYPLSPVPCYFLGEIQLARGELNSAIDWYEQTMARSPADSELHQRAQSRIDEIAPPAPAPQLQ